MINFRVTVLTRRDDGTDWCHVEGPFDTRAAAGLYAAEARSENPHAVVDVVAINDRGEVQDDRVFPARTPASDAARDQAMATARDRNITHHINELPAVIEIPPTRNEIPQDPWGNSLGYRG